MHPSSSLSSLISSLSTSPQPLNPLKSFKYLPNRLKSSQNLQNLHESFRIVSARCYIFSDLFCITPRFSFFFPNARDSSPSSSSREANNTPVASKRNLCRPPFSARPGSIATSVAFLIQRRYENHEFEHAARGDRRREKGASICNGLVRQRGRERGRDVRFGAPGDEEVSREQARDEGKRAKTGR